MDTIHLGTNKIDISTSQQIVLKPLGSKYFQKSLLPINNYYTLHIQKGKLPIKVNHLFTGKSQNKAETPHNWYIGKTDQQLVISVEFLKDSQLKEAHATLNQETREIKILISTHNEDQQTVIDPLFHPLGALIMVYLAHFSDGFMIHASGVMYENRGHIFTAVSGTGKSTMAKLWQDSGATLVNDDRLWIQKIDNQWMMFNTPMQWYEQKPIMAPVNNIFLIRQSTLNTIKQLNGISPCMQVMSNCIQHFYDKEMTSIHLDRVIDFATQVPVYDCGFKPDGEIVEVIKFFNT